METVVAVLVVILLVTGLIVGTTAALKASQNARRRSIGTKLTQEGVELIRNVRDEGWNDFYNINTTGTHTYCLTTEATLLAKTAACTNNITVTQGALTFTYSRNVRLTANSSSNMGVFVEVSWTEGGITRYSRSQSVLTNWR